MAKEKKTIKFQMMLGPIEAELIDDWGFAHRIRSRAEAIRQLVDQGKHYEDQGRLLSSAHSILFGKFNTLEERQSAIEEHTKQLDKFIKKLETDRDATKENFYHLLAAEMHEENPSVSYDDCLNIAKINMDAALERGKLARQGRAGPDSGE